MINTIRRHRRLIGIFCIFFIFASLIQSSRAEAIVVSGTVIVFVEAGLVGALIGASKYVLELVFTGEDFSYSRLTAHMTVGAAEVMAVLASALFGFFILESVVSAGTQPGITDYFVDLLEGSFNNVASTVSNVWDVFSSQFKESVNSLQNDLEQVIAPTIQSLINARGEEPIYSNFLPAWADFYETITTSNMSVSFSGMEYSDYYGACRLIYPGISHVEAQFNLDTVPSDAYMKIIHLTSSSSNAPNGGYSPIDIYINGILYSDDYDVAQSHGDHGWHEDNWSITSFLKSGMNTIRIELEDDPWAATHYWIKNISVFEGRYENQSPTLSNPRVTPSSGTASTTFEYLVDYYDPDGDPPDASKDLYIDGNGPYNMTLKSGTPSNGTYSYQTQLQKGTHGYFFSFIDNNGGIAISQIYSGPNVYSDGNLIINPVIQCQRISSALNLSYSLTGLGNWIELPITDNPIIDPIVIPAGSKIWFTAGVDSENFTYNGRELRHEGNLEHEGTGDTWWYEFLPNASGEYDLNVYFQYTPKNYTISGTVLRKDETPVPGGVELKLKSSEQNITQNSIDGSFSFTNVKGGIPVTIEIFTDRYAFAPSILTFNNLKDNRTNLKIVAYASDSNAPMINIEAFPPKVSMISSVPFSWTGQDDVTSSADLLYQCKLDGVDSDWSAWDSIKTKLYNLSNGSYTFWVRAKDEAGNINQDPLSYTFAVNAAPKFVSATRINRSVWASRVTLKMPTDAFNPSNEFVLLPEHSGIADSELVPVRIHRVDEITAIGANEILADELSLNARIKRTENGWLVTLPENIHLGQSAQYDIIWGKVAYFGWQEFTDVPNGFPNGGNSAATYLDEDLRLWKYAIKKVDRGGQGNAFENDTWLFMNLCDSGGCIIDEKLMRFVPGITTEYYNGDPEKPRGIYYQFWMLPKLGENSKVFFPWKEQKEVWNATRYDRYSRYGLQIFNTDGTIIAMKDGDYIFKADDIEFSKEIINGILWVAGDKRGNDNKDNNAWFLGLDKNGSEVIPRTVFDTIDKNNFCDLDHINIRPIGNNVFFLWEREWDTPENNDRQELMYMILDRNGSTVKQKTSFHDPVANDSDDFDDEYEIENCLADSEGKVWISFTHEGTETGSRTYNRYYVIFDTDGSIWKGPVATPGEREFRFCDKDGYIWTTENDEFFALNNDDTIAVAPRTPTWIPNQIVGQIAANVSSTGYRLYDRWSPQLIVIDMPSGVSANSMELFDLNLWDNNLHCANINLKKGDIPVWSHLDKFMGYTVIDVSGTLSQGPNVLIMTQDDFQGGQVLLTFPYVFKHTITASAGENGSISPEGSLAVDHGSTQCFTITPDIGFQVSLVTVNDYDVNAVTAYCFEDVQKDHTIHATFKPYTYNISGEVTLNGGSSSVSEVTLSLSGDAVQTINPEATGDYNFTGLEERYNQKLCLED